MYDQKVVILIKTAAFVGRHGFHPGNGIRGLHICLRHHLSGLMKRRFEVFMMN